MIRTGIYLTICCLSAFFACVAVYSFFRGIGVVGAILWGWNAMVEWRECNPRYEYHIHAHTVRHIVQEETDGADWWKNS